MISNKGGRVKALQNIAASIGVVVDESDSDQVWIYELILQGMLELEDHERDLVYFRYGLQMNEVQISKMTGIAEEDVLDKCLCSKQKLEKILKG
jgi:DNA-directed RNA polymerase specialized sigma subunit